MKQLFTLLLATIAFVACTHNDVEEPTAKRAYTSETLTIGFENNDNETRIQLNDAQKSVWNQGDEVSVFYRSDANQKWQYQGEDGERIGVLHCIDAGTATVETTRVVAIYPYNTDYVFNPETYSIQATLPAVQSYKQDSYGANANIMVSSGECNHISLKSACGWFKLQLTGSGEKVQSITLRGNNDEMIAGALLIDSSDAMATLTSTMSKEVILDCGEGMELGAESTSFYIAVPPQTFEQGITVEIKDREELTMTLFTDAAITIERNHIKPMAVTEFEADKVLVNNVIRYTATDKVTKGWTFDYFGANILSHVFNKDTGEGIITFDNELFLIGDYAFSNCDSITSITIPDSVTTIGCEAFYQCISLTSVTIPDSVTTIKPAAFTYCNSLAEFKGKFVSEDSRCLIIDNTLNSFAPAGLTEYTIPDSVTAIGDSAFRDCYNITSISIHDGITTIGDYAFSNCGSLNNTTIPGSVKAVGAGAFYACGSLPSIIVPDSVITIGDYAFYSCSELTSATIGNGVTTIGDEAFRACSSLTSVTIGNSITTIGELAFEDCSNLASVYCKATTPPSLANSYYGVFDNNASSRKIYVPAESIEAYESAEYWSNYADAIISYDFETGSVVVNSNQKICYTATEKVTKNWTFDDFGANILLHEWNSTTGEGTIIFDTEIKTIGERAFYKCNSLTSITIPDGVITMGDQVFSSCDNLTSATLGKYLTTISYATFSYCYKLTNISIPNNVTEIGNSAFRNCDSLTSITIPDGVMSIGEYAFFSCYNLADVKIPNSVTSIKDGAFKDCKCLTNITIPDSVNSIGDEAFKDCINLINIYCKATTPPSLGGSSVFDDNALDRRVYVLAESADAYRSAMYWNEYKIVSYDF